MLRALFPLYGHFFAFFWQNSFYGHFFQILRALFAFLLRALHLVLRTLFCDFLRVQKSLTGKKTLPSNPSNPSHPSHQTRRFAPRRKGFHWTPEGHCGCLVDFLSTTPNSMIFKITTGTCVLKTNFYTHKKKSHLPALILKFLTTTPNLTSNFET